MITTMKATTLPWSVAAGGRDANPNHFLCRINMIIKMINMIIKMIKIIIKIINIIIKIIKFIIKIIKIIISDMMMMRRRMRLTIRADLVLGTDQVVKKAT